MKNSKEKSPVYSSFAAKDIALLNEALTTFDGKDLRVLRDVGIYSGSAKYVKEVMDEYNNYAMDSIQGNILTPSITTPVQFLQEWLVGVIHALVNIRKIDSLIGIMTVGDWGDEQVVQTILENTGVVLPYSDYSNANYSSWNTNFEYREIARFETGLHVGELEDYRSSAIRINTAQEKRQSCAINLEILRNTIGFSGYNSGTNRTYGFLNDPNLPAYVTVAATGTGSSTLWSNKGFLNITADIRTAIAALRTQSGGNVDPDNTDLTLALPISVVDYLSTVSDFGISVREWIKQSYPRIRVEFAPQLTAANGGANVMYLYADSISDGISSDGGQTFIQMVPAKFKVLGVVRELKGFAEAFSNATAGVFLKRPTCVVRYTGI